MSFCRHRIEICHACKDITDAKLTALRDNEERMRMDMDKPPAERLYCAGCELRTAEKRLREAAEGVIKCWEWAEDYLPNCVPEYNYADIGWTQDFWIALCKLKVAFYDDGKEQEDKK